MSNLDLVILTEDDIPERSEDDSPYHTEEHGLEEDAEKLVRAWPVLMERLAQIIDSADEQSQSQRGFGLESVQFQIGIEAGFNIGFTGTGKAAITATFSRPKN